MVQAQTSQTRNDARSLVATTGILNFRHYDDPICAVDFQTHVVPDTTKCQYVLPDLSSLTGEWVGGGIMDGKCQLCYSVYSESKCNDCLAKKGNLGTCSSGRGQCEGTCPICSESHEADISDTVPSSCEQFSHVVHGLSLGRYKAWCPTSDTPCVDHFASCLNQGRCCDASDKCMKQDDYYSQCRPDCPDGWACNPPSTPLNNTSSVVETQRSLLF